MATLLTQNTEWGFWGTISRIEAEKPVDVLLAWTTAIVEISKWTDEGAGAVRYFLDGRYGRHFADDFTNFLLDGHGIAEAMGLAVDRWMTWTIGAQTSKAEGIPVGLPYLQGLVMACEIELDAMAGANG